MPWTLYCFYGDKRIIEDNYHKMVALVEKRIGMAKDHIFIEKGWNPWGDDGVNQWADHLSTHKTPGDIICSIYYYISALLVSRMAAFIGRTEDADRYSGLLPFIANAINDKYFDKEKSIYSIGTQASLLLPLYFGITPIEIRKVVLKSLVDEIVSRDYHNTTGYLSMQYLLPLLTEEGQLETAYRIAVQTSYPSWGYMVENGGTTMWEAWDGKEGSMNHYAFGGVGRWYFEYLAGLQPIPETPGFKRLILKPYIPEKLDYVNMIYTSYYGDIESSWRKDSGKLVWNVRIPPNTTAEAHIPCRKGDIILENGIPIKDSEGIKVLAESQDTFVYELGSGKYVFEILK